MVSVFDNEAQVGSFRKWFIRWLLLLHNQCLLSSELIYPHPRCLFGSRLCQTDGAACFSLFKIYTLVIFHTHNDSDTTIFFLISSFLWYFPVASHAHCFSSCSCSVIVQRTPVSLVHLIPFTSFSWLPHLCLAISLPLFWLLKWDLPLFPIESVSIFNYSITGCFTNEWVMRDACRVILTR